MMRTISIDRWKPLAEEPRPGHNRWHPDIEPIVEVGEGEDLALETRAACDGYLTPRSTVGDLAGLPVGAIHPLTGPVLVKGERGRW
jgi:formamidase